MQALAALRGLLANRAPALGIPWRAIAAAVAAIGPIRQTYSQHGEDVWLLEHLRDLRGQGKIYVDVGANHPSRISNTYLLYRSGFSGVVIEPNAELLRLHRAFRPRDIAIGVGCSARAEVARFSVTSAPVLSTFAANPIVNGTRVVRTEYLPVLPLDDVLAAVAFESVLLLSVDTEGHDAKVLQGAAATLERTHLVCVEVNDDASEAAVRSELQGRFELVRRFGCNLVWRKRKEKAISTGGG